MAEHSDNGPVAPGTGIGDVGDIDEALDRLDRLSGDPDLTVAERADLERAALQLVIEERRTAEAWRRYRALAIRSVLEPAVLAGHVAALGDLAVELKDVAALSRVGVELARLRAIARKRSASREGAQFPWPDSAGRLRTGFGPAG